MGPIDNAMTEIRDLLILNWWSMLLRGCLAILFGVVTFVWPGISLAFLVLLFGAYTLVDGLIAIFGAVSGRTGAAPRWATLFRGLLGVGVGLVTLFMPGITALALVGLFAAWAFLAGILEVVAALRLRKSIQGEWLLALSGLLSIGLGFILAYRPVAGALAIVLWVGAYALVVGVTEILLAFRLRAFAQHGSSHGPLGHAHP
jgi:uncharacterized membrane protein HdeD (DUF308 family)